MLLIIIAKPTTLSTVLAAWMVPKDICWAGEHRIIQAQLKIVSNKDALQQPVYPRRSWKNHWTQALHDIISKESLTHCI